MNFNKAQREFLAKMDNNERLVIIPKGRRVHQMRLDIFNLITAAIGKEAK